MPTGKPKDAGWQIGVSTTLDHPLADDRTRLTLHQERLADADERERQRTHWKRIAAELKTALDN